jgi:predicted DNA-binding transcriptional regulator AlpA
MITSDENDRVIWRPQLQKMMGVTSETIRRWMRDHRLPEPDVAMSRKTLGWRASTLRAHGVNLVI